jgi:hypothetical protein
LEQAIRMTVAALLAMATLAVGDIESPQIDQPGGRGRLA